MKLAIKWLIGILAAVIMVRFADEFALNAWIGHKKNDEAHSMHERHIIVDEINKHDATVKATWTNTDNGQPNVVVRNVFDPDKQDAIIAWAKALKQQGRVQRHIVIDFQKKIPHSDVPDTVLRTVEF